MISLTVVSSAALPWMSTSYRTQNAGTAYVKNSYVSSGGNTSTNNTTSSTTTSLTQSRYSSTRESYWNTASNFQENWWHDEGKLLTQYDALRTEALENGGALDVNDVMMNRNKMFTLQAMMQVYPKSGYYDEARR